jgi:ubiquinone biosynthesis monooxygenase Coq6
MDHSRTRPIESMQVWDGISGARIQFHSPLTQFDTPQPFTLNPPVDAMATLVENLNLQRGALRQLGTHPGAVELVDGSRVASIEEGEGGWPVVNLENPAGEATRSLRARLLVSDDSNQANELATGYLPPGPGVRRLIRPTTNLQIGADGFNSPVKAYSKIDTFGRAYDTHGIVASLQLAPGATYDATHTAWQRFLPEGPIAFLPVSMLCSFMRSPT